MEPKGIFKFIIFIWMLGAILSVALIGFIVWVIIKLLLYFHVIGV